MVSGGFAGVELSGEGREFQHLGLRVQGFRLGVIGLGASPHKIVWRFSLPQTIQNALEGWLCFVRSDITPSSV